MLGVVVCLGRDGVHPAVAVSSQKEIQNPRQRLLDLMNRAEVQKEFEKHGISKAEVLARVDSLTDEEVAALVTEIDQAPEGGYADAGIITSLLVAGGIVLALRIAGGVVLGIVLVQSVFKESPKKTSGKTKGKSAGGNQPLKTGPGALD